MLALSRKKADRVIETRRPEASSKNKGGKDPSPALDVRPFRAGLAAAAGAPVDLAPIRNQVEAATSQKIAKWVRRGEVEAKKGAPRGDNPSLRYAQPGDVVRVPPHVLRPGQSQISFDRVRDVMLGFLERLDGRSPAEARALAEQLGLLEVPGRVTADAKTVVLPDKNHHSTAMFAFKGWLTEVTKGLKSAKRPGLAALREVFLGDDAHVKIEVQDTFVGQDPGESEAALRSSSYYVGRDGQPSRVRPDLFSGLEDNPYRNLATHTRVKVEPAGKKDVELSTKQLPVWVKDPAAPDFVEFFVADVFAKAMAGAGREYDGRSALTEEDGVLLRDALRRVQADEDHVHHEALEKVLVVPEKLTNTDKLRKKLELSKKGRAKIDN